MTLEIPTFDELYEAGKAETVARNPALTDWNEGSNLDALTGAGAMQADEVIRIAIDLFMAQFVDTAEGADLDALALDRFGLIRKPASPSIGTIRVALSAVDPFVIAVGIHFSGSVNGATVEVVSTAEAQNVAVGVAQVDVTCASTATGLTSNIAAFVIDTIVDDIGDSGATCSQLGRFTGGSDAETDAQFRDRIRSYFQTVQRGTREALIYGAKLVAGVEFAAVDETNIAPEDGGYVLLIIGDPEANASNALKDLVEAEIENWRPVGIEVQVVASVREEITASIVVRVRNGSDATALAASIRAAVVAHSESLDPGVTWYRAASTAAVFDVTDDVLNVEFTYPTTDYTPTLAYNAVRIVSAGLNVTFVEE